MENAPRPAEENRPFLKLRFSSVLTILFLCLAALALAYVAGVMSGRNEMRAAAGPARESAKREAAAINNNDDGGILAPEDLDYARVLRNEKARQPKAPADPARQEEPGQQREAAAQEKQPAGESGEPAQAADGQPAETKTRPADQDDAAQDGMHDYVFQLGAFRDEESADNLRQKLEGRGLRTKLVRSGKLLIVQALLRGSAERAGEIIRIAGELRLGEPMLISKKAVSN